MISFRFLVCGALLCCGTMTIPAVAASAKAGEAVFGTRCKTCHGADGTGNPAIAKMFKVTMKPLAEQTDAEVKTAVTAGVGKMKPIAGVSADDLDNVIAYIHTLKK